MYLLTAIADATGDSHAAPAGFQFLSFHLNSIGSLLLTILIVLWVVCVFRIVWHLHIFHWLSRLLPESAVVILLGCVLGGVLIGLNFTDATALTFDNDIFFLVLIPPIILEAGYFLDKPAFFANFALILTHAFAGTIINAMSMGLLLWVVSPLFTTNFPILVAFTFGALISAVDPVAVIAIFEQVHVNSTLNILVFGESVLNDAISIVLYRFFLGLIPVFSDPTAPVDPGLAFLAIAQFLVVSLGGIAVGVVMAIIGSYACKQCDHLQLLIPLLVLVHAWLAYLIAEMVSLSGIMAILFCGIVMSRYIPRSASKGANVTVKFVLKLFASTTETLIFVYLGTATILHLFASSENVWDGPLIIFTVLFALPLRFMTVFSFNALHNRTRVIKVMHRDSFIMAYGGLRGAIAFALAYTLPDSIQAKTIIITTTLIVIWFTIFILGSTLQPILKLLDVKLVDKHEKSMPERVLEKLSKELIDGIHLITGHTASHQPLWLERLTGFIDRKLVRGEYQQDKDLLEAIKEGDHRRHHTLRHDAVRPVIAVPPVAPKTPAKKLQDPTTSRSDHFQSWMLSAARARETSNDLRLRESGPTLKDVRSKDIEMVAIEEVEDEVPSSHELKITMGGQDARVFIKKSPSAPSLHSSQIIKSEESSHAEESDQPPHKHPAYSTPVLQPVDTPSGIRFTLAGTDSRDFIRRSPSSSTELRKSPTLSPKAETAPPHNAGVHISLGGVDAEKLMDRHEPRSQHSTRDETEAELQPDFKSGISFTLGGRSAQSLMRKSPSNPKEIQFDVGENKAPTTAAAAPTPAFVKSPRPGTQSKITKEAKTPGMSITLGGAAADSFIGKSHPGRSKELTFDVGGGDQSGSSSSPQLFKSPRPDVKDRIIKSEQQAVADRATRFVLPEESDHSESSSATIRKTPRHEVVPDVAKEGAVPDPAIRFVEPEETQHKDGESAAPLAKSPRRRSDIIKESDVPDPAIRFMEPRHAKDDHATAASPSSRTASPRTHSDIRKPESVVSPGIRFADEGEEDEVEVEHQGVTFTLGGTPAESLMRKSPRSRRNPAQNIRKTPDYSGGKIKKK